MVGLFEVVETIVYVMFLFPVENDPKVGLEL